MYFVNGNLELILERAESSRNGEFPKDRCFIKVLERIAKRCFCAHQRRHVRCDDLFLTEDFTGSQDYVILSISLRDT